MSLKVSRLPPASARYLGYGKAAVIVSSDVEKIADGVFWVGDMIVRIKMNSFSSKFITTFGIFLIFSSQVP